MEKQSPKQPNFFNTSIGRYNRRSVQEYLVDSSESGEPNNVSPINWQNGPFIDDVVQGCGMQDCWLISSIQSLLETGEGGKENIKKIFKHVVNKDGRPRWVVLRLYPIKLYLEYRATKSKPGAGSSLFKIVSIPNRYPVDIHIDIKKDNMIKELGTERYEFKETADWVKYIEMAFKKFYRDKYITFVGDGWQDAENGGNYIYRHLVDALEGKWTKVINGKEIPNNIRYGYPFVGQSVLSGKKIESSWMHDAMGYGENRLAQPVTGAPGQKDDYGPREIEIEIDSADEPPPPEEESPEETPTRMTPEEKKALLSRKQNIISALNKLKKYAYCFPDPEREGYYTYAWEGVDSGTDKEGVRQGNIDGYMDYLLGKTPPPTSTEWYPKPVGAAGAKEVIRGRKAGKNRRIRPCAFVRTRAGGSHVMVLSNMTVPRQGALAVEDAGKISLRFQDTGRYGGGSDLDGTLEELLEGDPTFTIIAESGEKAKNHSVEKSKKNKNDINERIKKFKK